MSIKVNVEGSPEAVARFFKEMGKENFEYPRIGQAPLDDFSNMEYHYHGEKLESVEIEPSELTEAQKEKISELVETDPKVIEKVTGKKLGRPKKERTIKPEVVTPDPEFSDLPDIKNSLIADVSKNVIVEEPEKPLATREMVQAALKDYGLWLDQGRTVPRGQIKPYLLALLRKYGNEGVTGTPDLEEQYFEAVMQAAVSRIPPIELEEYL